MFTPPTQVETVLTAFSSLFSRPSWRRAQALLCGVLLAPANHALTAALRALGVAGDVHFQNCHRLFNRARWSAHQAARVLLGLLVRAFVPTGPVILGLEETVERRRGTQIEARAIYRDAARSSRECFQKTSGLRWLSLHLLVPIRWARRVWALPFLTALCPSERYAPYTRKGHRHKPLIERARGLIGQVRRWLPGRVLILVADSGYAALELLAWCARQRAAVTMITRLRLDAALYEPAPARRPRQTGRPALKGRRLPTLAAARVRRGLPVILSPPSRAGVCPRWPGNSQRRPSAGNATGWPGMGAKSGCSAWRVVRPCGTTRASHR